MAITAPVHIPSPDGAYRFDDYVVEYCPFCDAEVVVYSRGVTACPDCGKPLAPCAACKECSDICPYGSTGGDEDEFKPVTNPKITQAEIAWFLANN